jgi:hypothetical protein
MLEERDCDDESVLVDDGDRARRNGSIDDAAGAAGAEPERAAGASGCWRACHDGVPKGAGVEIGDDSDDSSGVLDALRRPLALALAGAGFVSESELWLPCRT